MKSSDGNNKPLQRTSSPSRSPSQLNSAAPTTASSRSSTPRHTSSHDTTRSKNHATTPTAASGPNDFPVAAPLSKEPFVQSLSTPPSLVHETTTIAAPSSSFSSTAVRCCAAPCRSGTVTALSTNTGAIRFTCCQCRRCFLVYPDGHRSSVTKYSSLAHATHTRLLDQHSRVSHSHDVVEVEKTDDAFPAFFELAAPSTITAGLSSSSSATPLPLAVEAAVRHSYTTCGTGNRYRPLVPRGAPTLTNGIRADAQHSSQTLTEQRALAETPHFDFFLSSAETFTDAQLTELMTHAQQTLDLYARELLRKVPFALANPKSLCGFEQTPNVSLTLLPRLRTADGTQTHASPFISTEMRANNEDAAALQIRQQQLELSRSRSSNCMSSGRRSPPDLTAVEGQVMLRSEEDFTDNNRRAITVDCPPLGDKQNEPGAANERLHADTKAGVSDAIADTASAEASARNFIPSPIPQETSNGQVSHTNVCCVAATAASCSFLKRKPSPHTATDPAAASEELPFDELCRRWMRLLVHSSSTLRAQPLCLDCWSDACIAPLQQRTKNALESVGMLKSILENQSNDDKRRLWTLVSDAPIEKMEVMSRFVNNEEHEGQWQSNTVSAQLAKPLSLPPLSLYAVAGNVFGSRENEWLDTLSQLSAPHQQRQQDLSLAVEHEFDVGAAQQGGSFSDNNHPIKSTPTHAEATASFDELLSNPELRQRYAELHELLLELEDARAQQASLDAQISELRDVLQALDTRTVHTMLSTNLALNEDNTDYDDGSQQKYVPALQSSQENNVSEEWAKLAVAHNIREVQTAFTIYDEAAERHNTMRDLAARHAFLSRTSIDVLCFPVDVSGPMGTIAGLRLGLVTPYPGSASTGGVVHGSSQRNQRSRNSECNHHGIHSNASCSCTVDEAMCLEGFVRRQVQYTQLLLSGHTTDTSIDYLEKNNENGKPADTSLGSNPEHISGNSRSVAHQRVSSAETNAACGYLLLLLNYLARVNGFSFQTAILRPAGDRSTVALLKSGPRKASRGGGSGATALATTSRNLFSPFNLFGAFKNQTVSATESFNNSRSASSSFSASTRTSSPSSYVVDYEVDFYITDRFFAWRTFGAACVAVAACVRELSDALHESLRCWQLRGAMVRRHSHEEAVEITGTTASAGAQQMKRNAMEIRGSSNLFESGFIAPLPLSQLADDVDEAARVRSRTARPDIPEATTLLPESDVNAASQDAANTIPFPFHPPYRVQNDTVDGFSVRHGSVSEAIWTLGMKKLLANVQWCMEATMELERLYSTTGEDVSSDVDAL